HTQKDGLPFQHKLPPFFFALSCLIRVYYRAENGKTQPLIHVCRKLDFCLLLLFLHFHVILSHVADPHQTKVFQGLPAVTAVKCAVCSRPSTRKTKLKENRIMKKDQQSRV